MSRFDEFIEEIASLSSDLRSELTNIRELDVVVENARNELENQAFVFFENAPTMSLAKRDSVFQSLLSEWQNIAEVADEKVYIAEWLENVLAAHLEKLDREIVKLKDELESEKPGVSATIEERVLIDDRVVNEKKRMFSKSPFKLEVDEQEFAYDSGESSSSTFLASSGTSLDDSSLYCICKRRSFGGMIACDNVVCPYVWFHYACVKIRTPPEGKWYCPKCVVCKVYLERID